MKRLPAVLLTGGASRRMGAPKATLLAGGETLATRTARILAAVCDPVVEVGPGWTALPAVREQPPGAGPLAALVAGATAAGGGPLLLVGVDLPRLTEPALRLLADRPGDAAVVPRVAGRLQLVGARYSRAAVEAARTGFAAGARRLDVALRDVAVEVIEESEWTAVAGPDAFVDVDTPADATRFGLAGHR